MDSGTDRILESVLRTKNHRMKNVWLILGLIFLCYSCKEYKEGIFIPNSELTGEILQKNGYKKIGGIDVLMYEKQLNNLTIQHQFYNEEGNKIGYHTWNYDGVVFKDIGEYETKIIDLGFIPMTEIKLDGRVAISSNKTHGIYLCSWNKSKSRLSITYQHPIY